MNTDNGKPDNNKKIENLKNIDYLLNKNYLYEINENYNILCFSDYNKIQDAQENYIDIKSSYETDNIRVLRIDRWVNGKDEHRTDKYKNILNVFAGGESNLAFLIKREKEKTTLYFILKNENHQKLSMKEISDNNIDLLKNTIIGNFNGTNVEIIKNVKENILFNKEQIKSISCLSNIPSEKSERFISQGLEKLLDGIRPESDDDDYFILILAEPLKHDQIQDIQNGYEELASAITPYIGNQFSIGRINTKSEGTMESLTETENIYSAITKTLNVSVGVSAGNEVVKGEAQVGFSHSKTEGKGSSRALTKGKNYNISVGTTENSIYNYQSYPIKGLLEKLQKQLERINNGMALGFWKCASYIIAKSPTVTINVANFLKSLTQGDESYIEPPIINTWNHENESFQDIIEYLTHFTHPIFGGFITPTYNISTTELSDIIAFPKKSISGLLVLECAEFGREVVTFSKYKGDILLGKSYHMHMVEENQPSIMLSEKSLASHTFITGTTGSGKSNTIYHLLERLNEKKIPFLVIEPAKGEYKHAFSHKTDISVYGTNPELSPLLRINPFYFPNGRGNPSRNIHILEHLDRLIEIFNVCWPMYAAMPAILKNAVEKSYEEAGWDLKKSINKYNPVLYPSFIDVVENVKYILDRSDYSDENKGNYKGALITRLESLTNGINGLIFTNDDIPNYELFDKNVIIDLSRVGSLETKALIMGLLVMRLQEYRMTSGDINTELKHITVLEEAHNLLRRTSTEQSSESANLLGKSVEMLANAIAEMRTYGEGFIIADQSPCLMDMSVIRNTNTKIIMRLPDSSDRIFVGKSANLNDNQIIEISKLPLGVAAVYQNDWIQPVLCKVIDYYEKNEDKEDQGKDKKRRYCYNNKILNTDDTEILKKDIIEYILSPLFNEIKNINVFKLRNRIRKSVFPIKFKLNLIEYLSNDYTIENINPITWIIKEMYKVDNKVVDKNKEIDDVWLRHFEKNINPSIDIFDENYKIQITNALIIEYSKTESDLDADFLKKWEKIYIDRGIWTDGNRIS